MSPADDASYTRHLTRALRAHVDAFTESMAGAHASHNALQAARPCAVTLPAGECTNTDRCGWCRAGCPSAEAGGTCCTPAHPVGRFVILHERKAADA